MPRTRRRVLRVRSTREPRPRLRESRADRETCGRGTSTWPSASEEPGRGDQQRASDRQHPAQHAVAGRVAPGRAIDSAPSSRTRKRRRGWRLERLHSASWAESTACTSSSAGSLSRTITSTASPARRPTESPTAPLLRRTGPLWRTPTRGRAAERPDCLAEHLGDHDVVLQQPDDEHDDAGRDAELNRFRKPHADCDRPAVNGPMTGTISTKPANVDQQPERPADRPEAEGEGRRDQRDQQGLAANVSAQLRVDQVPGVAHDLATGPRQNDVTSRIACSRSKIQYAAQASTKKMPTKISKPITVTSTAGSTSSRADGSSSSRCWTPVSTSRSSRSPPPSPARGSPRRGRFAPDRRRVDDEPSNKPTSPSSAA